MRLDDMSYRARSRGKKLYNVHIVQWGKWAHLKETAGEQAVLQGTKLPVIFLWGELVCEDPVHHCRLSQSDCTPVRVKNGAGGNEWLEGVG